jgi:hypothetical protein
MPSLEVVLVALDSNLVDLVEEACPSPEHVDAMEATEPPPRFSQTPPWQQSEVLACHWLLTMAPAARNRSAWAVQTPPNLSGGQGDRRHVVQCHRLPGRRVLREQFGDDDFGRGMGLHRPGTSRPPRILAAAYQPAERRVGARLLPAPPSGLENVEGIAQTLAEANR